jgi:hypothetical protein
MFENGSKQNAKVVGVALEDKEFTYKTGNKAGTQGSKFYMNCRLDCQGTTIFGEVVLVMDGVLSEKNIEEVKRWSLWDGRDPSQLASLCPGKEVQIVVEHYAGNDGQPRQKAKWINAIGSAVDMSAKSMPVKDIMAKYGSMFRASAGKAPAPVAKPVPQTATTPAMAPVTHQTPAPARPAPVAPKQYATLLSASSVYEMFVKKYGDGQEEKWFEFCDSTGCPDQNMFNQDNWKQVVSCIENDGPCPL